VASLFTLPLWEKRHRWWFIVVIFCLSQVTDYRVRSAWLAMFVVLGFFAIVVWAFRLPMRMVFQTLTIFILGTSLSLVLPAANWEKEYLLGPLVQARAQASVQARVQKDVGTSRTKTAMVERGNMLTTIRSNPGLDNISESSLNRDLILSEFLSLFRGTRSPNALTRLYLWSDLLENLLSIELHFFADRKVDPTTLGKKERNILESSLGRVIFPHEVRPKWARWLVGSQPLRMLFGVPFGEVFVPSRTFVWMINTDRFDPHNSHLAMLSRIGLIGFLAYGMLLWQTARRGLTFVQKRRDQPGSYVMLALLACFLFHTVHALTDVALENPYKGIFFWVLIGLIYAVPPLYEDRHRP
jgi:hypothetical protein